MSRIASVHNTVARIAVFTDVHANLPALDAALREIDRLGADAIYHTGDVIGIGPYPAECISRLLLRNATNLLMGNHDAWFAFGLPDPSLPGMSDDEREHQEWVHDQLAPSLKSVVGSWPYASSLRIEGVRLDFLHYPLNEAGSFRSPQELTPDSAPVLFQLPTSSLVFFGHDHRPWNIVGGSTRFVGPGSLGCSPEAAARFALVDIAAGGEYTLHFHSVPYDPDPLFRALDERRVPARDFIRRTFLPLDTGPLIA